MEGKLFIQLTIMGVLWIFLVFQNNWGSMVQLKLLKKLFLSATLSMVSCSLEVLIRLFFIDVILLMASVACNGT
jgi:hypothetical protein